MEVQEAESVTDRRRKRRKHPLINRELNTTGRSTVVSAREGQNDATDGTGTLGVYGEWYRSELFRLDNSTDSHGD